MSRKTDPMATPLDLCLTLIAALEARIVALEKDSHPPVDIIATVEESIRSGVLRKIG